MLITAVYWLFIALVATGKMISFVTLIIFTIAMPLTRIQIARQRFPRDLARIPRADLGMVVFGVVGTYVLLENIWIFLRNF